jgi:hypothetical protein
MEDLTLTKQAEEHRADLIKQVSFIFYKTITPIHLKQRMLSAAAVMQTYPYRRMYAVKMSASKYMHIMRIYGEQSLSYHCDDSMYTLD